MSAQPMPAAGGAPTDGVPRIGALGRMIGVLFNPRETYSDIARNPSWIVPVVVIVVISLAFGWVMNQRIDWGDYIRHQAEKSPRFAQLPEEQKQRALEPQIKYSPHFVYAFCVLGPLLTPVIVGAVYLLAFNMAGAGAKFKQALAVVAHAQSTTLISGPLGILTMWLRSYGDVTPENMLASNVGAFLGSDSPQWMRSLGGSLDIFSIWFLALIALGFAATNPKKISTGKAIGIVVGIWLVVVMAKVGWAAAFGS